jgi:Zn-dependent protease
VAAAGPGANLIQAILWAIALKILISMGIYEDFFIKMCVAGVSCNIVLMALNLIPIPPLDGGRIVTGLLPPGMAWQYSRAVRNVDFVCADSDGNFVLLYASVHENGTGNRSVVHLVRG